MTEEMKALFRANRIQKLRAGAFGDAAALYAARFENDSGAVPQLAEARNYAERWDAMRERGLGLLFWGQPGNGKTFAAACIANALCEQNAEVRMTSLGTVLNALPALDPAAKLRYLQTLRECELLILDDFGMERRTEYAQEQVFSIIDGRCQVRKPLIVTTNLSLQELKHPTGITEQRIFDRLLEKCVPVCFDGDSLRPQKAKEHLAQYKTLTGR